MIEILDFIKELWHNHPQVFYLALGWYVYSAAVQAMPPPKPDERGYSWLYNFCQGLGSNWRAIAAVLKAKREEAANAPVAGKN